MQEYYINFIVKCQILLILLVMLTVLAILENRLIMTATAHALVGGAIAYSTGNPALGITLSFLSHPLLDFIPHWDFGWGWRKKTKIKLFTEASIDTAIGITLSYLLFGQYINIFYFLACVLAAILWDLMEIPYWFFNWRFEPFATLHSIQHHIQGKAKLPWGILTQIVTVGIFILYANR